MKSDLTNIEGQIETLFDNISAIEDNGAKNIWDFSNTAFEVVAPNYVAFTKTDSSIRVYTLNPQTWLSAKSAVFSVPQNTNLIFSANVVVVSGVASTVVTDSADNNIAVDYNGRTTSGNYSFEFNTGSNDNIKISLYATLSTLEMGDVTYTDLMLRNASITDATYTPYAMTNKQLTDRVNTLLPGDWNANQTIASLQANVKRTGLSSAYMVDDMIYDKWCIPGAAQPSS